MKLLATIALGLACCLPMTSAIAQDEEALDRIRSDLEQARQNVAEAAQELARLQRELFEVSGGGLPDHWQWQSREDGSGPVEFDFEFDLKEGDHAHAVAAAFPPRLGVLLGGDEAGESNRIVGLTPGGGADEAGLQADDRLLSVSGRDVSEQTSARVREILGDFASGDQVEVVVQRGEESISVPVILGSALDNVQIITQRLENLGLMDEEGTRNIVRIINATDAPDAPIAPLPPLSGMLTGLGANTDMISNHEGLAAYFGTDGGVLILRIDDENSMNLLSGDVILAVEGEEVDHPVDVGRALLNMEPGSDITLQVVREGLETTLYGTVPTSSMRPSGPGLGRLMRMRAPPAPLPPKPAGNSL